MDWSLTLGETIPILIPALPTIRNGLANVVPGDIIAGWVGRDGAYALHEYLNNNAPHNPALKRAFKEACMAAKITHVLERWQAGAHDAIQKPLSGGHLHSTPDPRQPRVVLPMKDLIAMAVAVAIIIYLLSGQPKSSECLPPGFPWNGTEQPHQFFREQQISSAVKDLQRIIAGREESSIFSQRPLLLVTTQTALPGGMGKTTVAREVARRLAGHLRGQVIEQSLLAGLDSETIMLRIIELMKCDLPTPRTSATDAYQTCLLRRPCTNVILYDDAYEDLLQRLLPTDFHCAVIVASRYHLQFMPSTMKVELTELDQNASFLWLESSYNSTSRPDAMREGDQLYLKFLARVSHGIPLVLQVLSFQVANLAVDVADVVAAYNLSKADEVDNPHSAALHRSLATTFRLLNSEKRLALLQCLSFGPSFDHLAYHHAFPKSTSDLQALANGRLINLKWRDDRVRVYSLHSEFRAFLSKEYIRVHPVLCHLPTDLHERSDSVVRRFYIQRLEKCARDYRSPRWQEAVRNFSGMIDDIIWIMQSRSPETLRHFLLSLSWPWWEYHSLPAERFQAMEKFFQKASTVRDIDLPLALHRRGNYSSFVTMEPSVERKWFTALEKRLFGSKLRPNQQLSVDEVKAAAERFITTYIIGNNSFASTVSPVEVMQLVNSYCEVQRCDTDAAWRAFLLVCNVHLGKRHYHSMELREAFAVRALHEEAAEILQDVWEIKREEYGATHPSTLLTRKHLLTLQCKSNWHSAMSEICSITNQLRLLLGPWHAYVMETRDISNCIRNAGWESFNVLLKVENCRLPWIRVSENRIVFLLDSDKPYWEVLTSDKG